MANAILITTAHLAHSKDTPCGLEKNDTNQCHAVNGINAA